MTSARTLRAGCAAIFTILCAVQLWGKGAAPAPANPRVNPAILAIVGTYEADPAGPFRTQWDRLASHKADQGLPVEFVRLADVLAGTDYGPAQGLRASFDNAEKVKNFIRQKKLENWGTLRYAIVGENYDDNVRGADAQGQPRVREVFPVRYSAFDAPAASGKSPTSQLYYGDLFKPDGLSATWDDDADGIFDELNADDFEYFSNPAEGDLFVGYLPVLSNDPNGARMLEVMVKKIIGYEDPAYDPDGAGGPLPAGHAYPRIAPGNWFLNTPLFGSDIWYPPFDEDPRSAQYDCERIRDRIIRRTEFWMPQGASFVPINYFIGDGLPAPFTVTAQSIPIFCDRVTQGAGIVYTEGHGGNDTIEGTNDWPYTPPYFSYINNNWRTWSDFGNFHGPYPIHLVVGCHTCWTDAYTNPYDNPNKWGMQCLGEELVTASYGPSFIPYGHVAMVGFSRGEYEDSSFANAFFHALTRGRAARLGEIYSEAQRVWLHRQDLWADWRDNDPPNNGDTGGYFHANQVQATYIGDPSLKLPDVPAPPQLTPYYRESGQAAGLVGLAGANVTCAVAADLDGDGLDDIVLGADQTANGNPSWRVKVLGATGPDAFVEAATLANSSDRVRRVAVADVNSDGRPDLFVASDGADRLYLAGPAWSFSEAPSAWGAAGSGPTTDAQFADLDADGRADLVVVEGGALKAYRNTGSSFTNQTAAWGLSLAGNVQKVVIGDANGDLLPDLLVETDSIQNPTAFFCGEDEGIWRDRFVSGRYNGVFRPGAFFGKLEGADLADLDGDGKPEFHLQLVEPTESGVRGIADAVFAQGTDDGKFSSNPYAGTNVRGGILHKGDSAEVLFEDFELNGMVDAFFLHRHGARICENRGNWEFATWIQEDGLPDTDRMRAGCIVDAGEDAARVLGVRYAGHEGIHPTEPLQYWVRQEPEGINCKGPNRWVRLRLRGAGAPASATDAIGARVTLESTGDGVFFRRQSKVVTARDRSAGLLFGLFQDTQVTSCAIEWPNGRIQTLEFVPVNATTTAAEDSPGARPGQVAGFSAAIEQPEWDRVNLSWQAVAGAAGYEIWRSVNDGMFVHWQIIPSGSQTAYADLHGPSDYGTTYQYRIRAVSNWGTGPWAPPSAPLFFEPRPEAPSEAGVIRLQTDNLLNWAPPGAGNPVQYYEVHYKSPGGDWTLLAGPIAPSADGHRLTHTGGAENLVYRISSVNPYGTVSVERSPGVPTAQSLLTIQPVGGDLLVPPGSRYQLRASISTGTGGTFAPPSPGGADDPPGGEGFLTVPITYLALWQSSNPRLPIDPPGTGRLRCDVQEETDVSASLGQFAKQEHYRVVFQGAAGAPQGNPKKGAAKQSVTKR